MIIIEPIITERRYIWISLVEITFRDTAGIVGEVNLPVGVIIDLVPAAWRILWITFILIIGALAAHIVKVYEAIIIVISLVLAACWE